MTLPRLIDAETDATLTEQSARVPEPYRRELLDYLRHGAPMGSWLKAVLENNLGLAVMLGDETCRVWLVPVVLFIYNFAPADTWGSPYAVKQWLERGAAARAERELTGEQAGQALGAFVAQKAGQ